MIALSLVIGSYLVYRTQRLGAGAATGLRVEQRIDSYSR